MPRPGKTLRGWQWQRQGFVSYRWGVGLRWGARSGMGKAASSMAAKRSSSAALEAGRAAAMGQGTEARMIVEP